MVDISGEHQRYLGQQNDRQRILDRHAHTNCYGQRIESLTDRAFKIAKWTKTWEVPENSDELVRAKNLSPVYYEMRIFRLFDVNGKEIYACMTTVEPDVLPFAHMQCVEMEALRLFRDILPRNWGEV